MPRPKKTRIISGNQSKIKFVPVGVNDPDEIGLGFDELEALRLTNIECLSHEESAKRMGISRQLVGLLLSNARKKITEALVNSKAIKIEE